MILAYVEGLPIPNSSNFLTRLASEYLGGGWVKCCSSVKSLNSTSPLPTSGNIFSSSLFSSNLETFKKPSNFKVEPLAIHIFLLSSDVIVIVYLSNFADSICEDIDLDHIKL